MNPSRRRLLVLLSSIVAVAATWLWWDMFDISLAQLTRVFAALRWWAVAGIVLLLATHVALSAWRWSLIEVGIGGERPPFAHAFAAGGLALGLGSFLPAPIINVACRSVGNKLAGGSGVRGALSGGFDQGADFAVTVIMAIPAALALALAEPHLYLIGAPLALLAGLTALPLVPLVARSPLVPKWARPHAKLPLVSDRVTLLKIYGLSVLRLVNLSLLTLMVHWASGAGTVSALLVAVPLVTLAISVSMLPGAFGASEWSFSAVLAQFGLGSEDVVSFVLANRIVLTLGSVAIAVTVTVWLIARAGRGSRPEGTSKGAGRTP